MKLSTFAAALTFGLAAAAPAPVDNEYSAVADNVISTLFERGILEARACSSNQLCSSGKCYTVTCIGHNTCYRNPTGGKC